MPPARGSEPVVGFVGLGQIGAPMASHLTDWPGGLVVCDARQEATRPAVEAGAVVATSPAEVGERASVISVMVRDDAQVWEVLEGILTTASEGTVVAVHSTIGADTAPALAERAAAAGVDVVDAPVSGGFMGAHSGELAVLVGGEDAAVERCRAPFSRWASLVSHLGPVGAGTRAKLARNLLHFTAFVAVNEAQQLAEACGIDALELARVIRHTDSITGGPSAVMIRRGTDPLADDDPLRQIFVHTRELGEKDLTLALAEAERLGLDLPLAQLALGRLGAALGVPHV